MTVRHLFTGVLLLAMTSGAGHAQFFENNRFGFGIYAGASKLQGDFETTNAGFTAGYLFRFMPVSRLALSYRGTVGTMSSGLDAVDSDLFNHTFSASVFLLPQRRINPFLTLGWSRLHYAAKADDGSDLLRADGSKMSDWVSATHLGAGIELPAGKHWAVNTLLSYSFSNSDEIDGVVSGKKDGFFTGLVGLVYYFQPEKRLETPVHDYAENGSQPQALQTAARQLDQPANRPFSNGVDFEPGSTKLLESSKKQLDKIFDYLIANPNERIELLSNEDIGQIEPEHQQLVIYRALAIKGYLVSKGIAPGRIIVDTLEED